LTQIALSFHLQIFDVFGPMLTGASLWSAEVLMAELTAKLFAGYGAKDGDARLKCIELGCGSSPVAGLVAASLGFDVVLTDMPVVLQGAKQNVSHNFGVVEKHAETLHGLGRLEACTLWWGEELSAMAKAFAPFDVVLCADCLYKGELFDPLAATLARLLAPIVDGASSVSQALFVYQRRQNEVDERTFFTHTLPRHGLDWKEVPLDKNFIKSTAAFNWLMRRFCNDCSAVDPASFFDVRLIFHSPS
jgi:hypothetical protein